VTEQNVEGVIALVDELLASVEAARKMPLTNKIVIDQDELLDLLEQLRDELPAELSQAQTVLRDRDKIITGARAEAERMLRESGQRAEELARDNVITDAARKHAEEIVEQAGQVAREIRTSANEYTDGLLLRAQETMAAVLKAVDSARNELRAQAVPLRAAERAVAAKQGKAESGRPRGAAGDEPPAEFGGA
jgi:cell division septum initiation protein DivIVA